MHSSFPNKTKLFIERVRTENFITQNTTPSPPPAYATKSKFSSLFFQVKKLSKKKEDRSESISSQLSGGDGSPATKGGDKGIGGMFVTSTKNR